MLRQKAGERLNAARQRTRTQGPEPTSYYGFRTTTVDRRSPVSSPGAKSQDVSEAPCPSPRLIYILPLLPIMTHYTYYGP